MKQTECVTMSVARRLANAIYNAARFYFALRFVFFGFWLKPIPIREECCC